MCTILFSSKLKTAAQHLPALLTRSRDFFGFVVKGDRNPRHFPTFTQMLPEVVHLSQMSPDDWILLHGRAVPESEPDFLSPNPLFAQPCRGKPFYFFAFHGLVNNLKELVPNFPDDLVDTQVFAKLFDPLFEEDLIPDPYSGPVMDPPQRWVEKLAEILQTVKGSFVLFVVVPRLELLFVASNFLAVFLDKDVVSTVPVSPFSQPLEPYTVYAFDLETLSLQASAPLTLPRPGWAVVCSSGLDSTTCLALVKALYPEDPIHAVHFTYGQHAQAFELQAVKGIADYFDAKLHVVDVSELIKALDHSSLLLQDQVKVDSLLDMERDVHYVRLRNTLFATIAAGIAEQHQLGHVVMGVNLTEGLVYSDNGNRWFYSMRETLKTAGQLPIRFSAPLLNLLKKEIIRLGQLAGAPYRLTVSCYHPQKKGNQFVACGRCGSCHNRFRAFMAAGFSDPVPYAQLPDDRALHLPLYAPAKNISQLVRLMAEWGVSL